MSDIRPAWVAAALLLSVTVAVAQPKAVQPSVYLKCDGSPPHRSAGEMLGRVLLLSATLGLAGQGETQDVTKRAHGLDGIEACDTALAQESDPTRKTELMLARAIHHIEAGDNDAAVDDARKAPSLAGTDDIGLRHSLLLSALQLQAAALVRKDDLAGAQAAALQMADASPYDVTAQIEAMPYVQLGTDLTPQKQAYIDRLVKMFPEALGYRAIAHQWAGKYLEAAADYADMAELRAGFAPDSKLPRLPDAPAMRAAMLALGGQMAESNAVAAQTRTMIDFLTASGNTALMQSAVDAAEQALDFQGIVADLVAGRAAMARTKFLARSRWSVPATPAVAELAERLRQGAPAAELTGSLAADGETLRRRGLAAYAGQITLPENAVALLYASIRRPIAAADYKSWSSDVWNTKASAFLHKRAPNENYVGEVVAVSPLPGFFAPPHQITVAAGEALLMHCALLAQARGAKGFELFPGRKELQAFLFRFGNPGEPGMPASVTFDAATVVADLSSEFPNPAAK